MINKKGYTLIELMVVLFIILTLFSSGILFFKSAKKIQSCLKIKKYEYEIHNLISYGKCICKDKKKIGKIKIDSDKNTIRFMEGFDNIEKIIVFPNEFNIFPSVSYYISETGRIKGSNTITIMDNNGKCYDISIKTGVDTVTIKGEVNEEK